MKLNKTDETAFSQLACSSLKKISGKKKRNKTKKKRISYPEMGKKVYLCFFMSRMKPHLAESDVTYKHAKSITDSLSIKSFSIYPRTK